MNDRTAGAPTRSALDRRREREAEALRANLRRRKDQQRARQDQPASEQGGASGDGDTGHAPMGEGGDP